MSAPNRSTLWGETLVEELVAAGVDAACLAPGSRSTPLTLAVVDNPAVAAFSILDERSAAYFALGRGRRTGRPTAVVCTSGTAAANFHPAVVEASQSRVPLLVLTADRPAELHDSGANQTVDQRQLYGDAVRYERTLPEPAPAARRLRSLRVTANRAVAKTGGANPGPVHLNVPFAKPLEPSEVPGDVPEDLAAKAGLGPTGRDDPSVRTTVGRPTLEEARRDDLAAAISVDPDDGTVVERGLLVAGPMNPARVDRDAVRAFLEATGVPILADPLSGLRYGPHVTDHLVCGGYDAYVDTPGWPAPDFVLRIGASPTSKSLRQYLRDAGARQVVVDPAGDWPEATFTATEYIQADPSTLLSGLADRLPRLTAEAWRDRWTTAERVHWETAAAGHDEQFFEGSALATVIEQAPDPATVFVSNSMPVRDCDRFGRPHTADLTVVGNRGASGIDGIVSSGLGAGSATDDPLVVVTGDLAYYHDMNGLLSVTRCGVDATVVLVNNDGGGIFHKLPIESFDPPFTEQFKTPHGLDFEPTGALYDLEFDRVEPGAFERAYVESLDSSGTQVLELRLEAAPSHRFREELATRVREHLAETPTGDRSA
jgi:2-succinyl-5-enolpyruvyl-6-hydroxy-3-cyclohexene-1-carboxylate synthase